MLTRRLPLLITVIALVGALITNPFSGHSASKERAKNSLNNDEKILHVLNRLGYGPRPGDVERVKQIGLDRYIDLQLYPEKIDDAALEARLKSITTLDMDAIELAQAYPKQKAVNGKKNQKDGKKSLLDQEPDEEGIKKGRAGKGIGRIERDPADIKGRPQEILLQLSQQHLLRAVYSERQLNEAMVDFWTNHFNVFWAKGADRYLLTPYMRDAIRPNAMGNFRELLAATAHSPAMLFYLDNWTSVDPKAADRVFSDREGQRKRMERRRMDRGRFGRKSGFDDDEKVMRNRADQAVKQNKKRSLGLNENYARELLELHTMGVDGGYTQKDVTEVARCLTGWSIRRDGDEVKFNFNERLHDQGEKIVLGQKISAGGGMRDGEKVLDILMNHPSTARFISTKLVRRFVSDNPPQSLVDRVAAVFKKTDGDIRTMLKTIFTSPEFYSRENYQAKIKSPLALVASALRAVDADTDAGRQALFSIARMGQPLFLCQPPTGYGDTADKWVNTASLVERLNFAVALCEGRIPGTTPRLLRNGASPASLDAAIDMFMHGPVSESTREAIVKEIGERGFAAEKLPKAAGFLLGSPEFQKM